MARSVREAVAWIGAEDGFPAAQLTYDDRVAALQAWKDGPLRQAYRRKAMALHPDRNPSPDATAQFQDLEECHRALQGLECRRPQPPPTFQTTWTTTWTNASTTTASGSVGGGFASWVVILT